MDKEKVAIVMRYWIISLLIAVVVGTVLMIAVYSLPVKRIKENVKRSLQIYKVEDIYYSWGPGIASTQIDNVSDELMLDIAAFDGPGSVVEKAMMNYRVDYEDSDRRTDDLIKWIENGKEEGKRITPYARYWHGYLVWLKPLLVFMTVSDIRILSMCFQFTLMVIVLLGSYKELGYKGVVPVLLTLLCLNPISTAICITYMNDFCVALISLVILMKYRSYGSRDYWKLFFWMGIVTSFLDVLTYPIVGLGINLIFLLVLKKETLKGSIIKIVFSSVSWGVGYVGMWGNKWMISYFLTGSNTIRDALERIGFRLSGEVSFVEDMSIPAVFMAQFNVLKNKAGIVVSLLLILLLAYIMLVKGYRIRVDVKEIIPIGLVCSFPFIWYMIVRNHSAIHYRFTYRGLSVVVLALGMIVSDSLDKDKKG